MYVKSKAVRLMNKLATNRPDIVTGTGKIDSVKVTYRDGVIHVNIDQFLPKESIPQAPRAVDLFRQYLSVEIGEPVVVELDLIGVDMVQIRSEAPVLPDLEAQPDQQN